MIRRTRQRIDIVFLVSVLSSLVVVQSGCRPLLDQRVVASAMSGVAADEQRVVYAGEPGIPLIFKELRSHPDTKHKVSGWSLIEKMIFTGTADASAPTIRRVLQDPNEAEHIRSFAATALSSYWSPSLAQQAVIDNALMDQAIKDRSVSVRLRCIRSIGTRAHVQAARRKNWSFDSRLIRFFSSMLRDKNASVRKASVDAVGFIANSALADGDAELPWVTSLLSKAKKDQSRSVRRSVMEALLRIEQTRSRPIGRR